MVSKTKAKKSTIPTVNLMWIAIFHRIILNIGDYVLLGGFKIVDEVLGVFGVKKKIV